MMKVWQLPAFGLERLEMAERPIPEPGAGEMLVRVSAVSLNYRDRLVVEGKLLPERPAMPFVPVSDMAGKVVAVGSGVTRARVGDRVMGNFWTQWIDREPPAEMMRHGLSLGGPLPGMLAEYVLLPDEAAVAPPPGLSDEEAATLPIAALTAWFALVETGGLRAGQTVLVQGTGGVSLFGMQIARALGARVIVTSRSVEKLQRAEDAGAWKGVNTAQEPDWARQVLDLTDGQGVDHVLELIGGDNLGHSIEALASGGRISQIGIMRSSEISFPALPLMLRRATLHGISVGHRRAFEDMNRAIGQYAIKPLIEKVYAFEETPAGFNHLERGAFGKVVIKVRE